MEPSFLELPLDRELYEPKKYVSLRKDPLRILITDAGGKIAYNVIYQICSGNVFGPDQEIILHLINARGSVHHKAVVLELEQSGFSTCTGKHFFFIYWLFTIYESKMFFFFFPLPTHSISRSFFPFFLFQSKFSYINMKFTF